MKKTFSLIFSLFLFQLCAAQQLYQYTQYFYNQYLYNPAVAGSKNCLDAKMGGRLQWLQFEGAPRSAFAAAYGRIKLEKSMTQKGYHGVGVLLNSDFTGSTGRTGIQASYAYHVPVAQKWRLGLGVFAGLMQYRFNMNNYITYEFDEVIGGGSGSVLMYPDVGAGIWAYSKKSYVGISGLQLYKARIKGYGNNSRITPHMIFTAGKHISQSADLSIIPSAMIKFTPLAPPGVDLTCMFDFRNFFAYGLTYRYTDAVCGIIKLRAFRMFDLGYSFDFITSKVRKGTSLHTHEITLGITACGGKESKSGNCPAYE